MSLDLKSIQLFARVAALGAIGKAGAAFSLSPTAATQRLQALEAELGVKLLNRTTRAVSLTHDGEVFLAYAARILADVEDARVHLAGGATRIRGELRVAASATFGRRYIVPHVAEFLSLHPEASLRLDLSDAVVDIVEQGFDLAIRVGEPAPSTLMIRKLADNPRTLVAAPAYLDRFGSPSAPLDLARHWCLALGGERSWRLRGRDGGSQDVRVEGRFSTNSGEAITEAALGGLGIALKSRWDVATHLETGALLPVLPDYVAEPPWSVWAVRPSGHVIPARVRAFTRFLEDKLGHLPA